MLCKIADLIVEVPAAGDLVSRCQDYLYKPADENLGADFEIRTDLFRPDAWPGLTQEQAIYVESGTVFRSYLMKYQGIVLHSSAVELDGKAYLFSAPCGTGKSTHTRLWQAEFGPRARVFNDDKPALRCLDGKWYAYGTPWCGKDGININLKAPVAGICFLKQGSENRIRRLSEAEAIQNLIWQTVYQFSRVDRMELMLGVVDSLVNKIPVFELVNRPEPAAVRLSCETMRRAAEEIGL